MDVTNPDELPLGAHLTGGGCRFTVWAPHADDVELHVLDPDRRVVAMDRLERGYHTVEVPGAGPGNRYRFQLDGRRPLPDPASRYQPEGVAGPSAIVDPDWQWNDDGWRGIGLDELVLYELHVGTYTGDGTFEAILDCFDHLVRLGVTAIELMPIAQFPGTRNWGYDGVGLFAAQHSYGGPDGLRHLVDAAHGTGLAVILDVVYNHMGPEGNHLGEFGPYFTDRYRTPWGEAINVDGPGSDEVRRFLIDNALMWATDFHIDGFRLDAVHAISDASAYPFVEELTGALHSRAAELGRTVLVIAEDGRNDPRLTRRRDRGGYGLDAQWNDDFHHAVHVTLTGEGLGYYRDFTGPTDVATAVRDGFVYGDRRSSHRGHRVGRHAADTDPSRLVVFSQNHDQVGNRAAGERLITLAGPEAVRAAATLVALSPGIPLLFMGEEWAETAPFLFFVDHADRKLRRAVRDGRRAELAELGWQQEDPDPTDRETFERSRVDHGRCDKEPCKSMLAWYRALIALRRERQLHGTAVTVHQHGAALVVTAGEHTVYAVNLSAEPVSFEAELPAGRWQLLLDSGEPRFGSVGPARLGPEADHGGIGAGDRPTTFDLPPWTSVVLGRDVNSLPAGSHSSALSERTTAPGAAPETTSASESEDR